MVLERATDVADDRRGQAARKAAFDYDRCPALTAPLVCFLGEDLIGALGDLLCPRAEVPELFEELVTLIHGPVPLPVCS